MLEKCTLGKRQGSEKRSGQRNVGPRNSGSVPRSQMAPRNAHCIPRNMEDVPGNNGPCSQCRI